ncbi:conserved hypothetical protein [Zunongwangia profunda SM-A87]|uniref:Capsule assembly protein Wzi n=1 Tax=Zunongwangia profunda (strain DSM 18752 / CCTCC AB 206139 / SM-A87) TaxID=655815 RepID=D5BFI1_ZUNPS|nr:conserved hypothetical protein [Zunongwangia profunda SM-A87]
MGGAYSNTEELPFYFYKNTKGRLSDQSEFYGTLMLDYSFDISRNFNMILGGAASYDNSPIAGNHIWMDELYSKIVYKNQISLTLGRKHQEENLSGLSASNANFAWSLNTRAMPGLQLTLDPFYFDRFDTFGVSASFEQYLLEKDRSVSRAQIHHKNFYLLYNRKSWAIKAGIEHYAMYGGTSEFYGEAPSGLQNYLKVFFGREGGSEAIGGERQNVIGNHLGTYVFDISYTTNVKYNFVYNHFFEDGSSSKFSNFPDGSYALYIEDVDNRNLWKAFIFEIYYTKNRSKNYNGPENVEQYFNNFLFYKSGWSYQQRILGVPFFDFDSSAPRGSIVNDEFIAYHLGMNAELAKYSRRNTFPLRLLLTHVNYSNSRPSVLSKSNVFYSYLDIGLIQNNPFNLNISFGTEFSEGDKPIFAAGLSVSKSFF